MKKVFKGIRFSIYQRKQKTYNGQQQTFEIVKRNGDGVQIVAIIDNKILVPYEKQPHRKKGKYGAFGGIMEQKETPLQGAKRELFEETGIIFKDIKLRHIDKRSGNVRRDEYRYIAKNPIKKGIQTLDPGEDITLKTMTFDEWIAIVMSDRRRNRNFGHYIACKYIYPNKLDELKKILGLQKIVEQKQ